MAKAKSAHADRQAAGDQDDHNAAAPLDLDDVDEKPDDTADDAASQSPLDAPAVNADQGAAVAQLSEGSDSSESSKHNGSDDAEKRELHAQVAGLKVRSNDASFAAAVQVWVAGTLLT